MWVLLLHIAGCQEPTQINLHVKTDVPHEESRNLTLTAAPPNEVEGAKGHVVVTKKWDETDELGTMVVVPDGGWTAKVGSRAVMGVRREAMSCTQQDMSGCIVARCRVPFMEHKRLFLPVGVHAQCEGVPCEADSTCNEVDLQNGAADGGNQKEAATPA